MRATKNTFGLMAAGLVAFSSSAQAKVIDADWMDPNFALCEDVGVHATGRVKASAQIAESGPARTITSLSITTNHVHSHQLSGTISWTDAGGIQRSTRLQTPWFDVISAPGSGQMLVLPRGSGSGPSAQTPLVTAQGTPITLNLSLAFRTTSGICPSSFKQTWNLP